MAFLTSLRLGVLSAAGVRLMVCPLPHWLSVWCIRPGFTRRREGKNRDWDWERHRRLAPKSLTVGLAIFNPNLWASEDSNELPKGCFPATETFRK